jgi:outer membrane protein TolC
MKQYSTTIIICLIGIVTYAQSTLFSPTQAIQTTLQNNYNLQLARNNVAVATNNTDKRLNGYLPTLALNAGPNANLGSSTQQLGSGEQIAFNNAFSWSVGANATANYLIYDRTRDLTLQQLKSTLDLTNLELRQAIELNMQDVLTAYYELAQLSERIELQEETIQLSQRRRQRAQYRFDYGQANKLEVLNAQVDIQRDTVNLINLEQQVKNARRNLNFLIGRDIETDFQVDTSLQYLEEATFQSLMQSMLSNNIQLLILQQNRNLLEYDLQLNDAVRYPSVSTTAGYSLNYQDNPEQSFFVSSNSRGWTLGVNVAYTLYDGGLRKMREQNIKLNANSLVVQRQQLEQQLLTTLTNAWESYQNALFILEVERQNLATNQLNFERTEEQFKAGQVSSVEIRQAQLNLLNAAVNLNTAKYDAKIIELQLLQLSGRLMEEN